MAGLSDVLLFRNDSLAGDEYFLSQVLAIPLNEKKAPYGTFLKMFLISTLLLIVDQYSIS